MNFVLKCPKISSNLSIGENLRTVCEYIQLMSSHNLKEQCNLGKFKI